MLALAPPVPGLSVPGAQGVVVGPLVSRLARRGLAPPRSLPAVCPARQVSLTQPTRPTSRALCAFRSVSGARPPLSPLQSTW